VEVAVGGGSIRSSGPLSGSRGRLALVAGALATLFVSACAGDGPPPGIGTSTTSTTLVGGGSLLVPLQQTVFTPSCALAGCHDAATQIQGLDLSSTDASFADLVGVDSFCTKVRVVPNNVTASYLVDKVGDGAAFCGAVMPQGLPALTAQQLQLIRDWINQGAPPASGLRFLVTTTSTSATAPAVSTTATTTSTTTGPTG